LPRSLIFFTTDIHGSEKCFLKFINAGKFYKANVIILGGDITGKKLIPIIEQPDGSFRTTFLASERTMRTQSEVNSVEQSIRDTGYYPYRTNPKEMDELRADEAKVKDLFSKLMVESLKRWSRLAEERLKETNVKCFVTPGNDDFFVIDPVLKECRCIANPEGIVVDIDDNHEMVSSGYSNMTPWKCPRDISEEELARKIDATTSQVSDMKNCIFNFHCPPYGTPLDEAPKLDKEMRPVLAIGGQPEMEHVGSVAVMNAIKKHQPLLGLHGHIHESRGSTKIGRTLCLNPGSEYLEGILRGALVSMDEKGVKDFMFISS